MLDDKGYLAGTARFRQLRVKQSMQSKMGVLPLEIDQNVFFKILAKFQRNSVMLSTTAAMRIRI